MTRDEFRAWRESPQGKLFFEFLRTRVDGWVAGWVSGNIGDPEKAQVRANNTDWIIGLEWADLNTHYGWEDDGIEPGDTER